MSIDVDNLLAGYDAAPARQLSATEQRRRDERLMAILTAPEPPQELPRRRRRYVLIGASAAAAVVALAVLAVPVATRVIQRTAGTPLLSSAELAAWTSAPARLTLSSGTGHSAMGWCTAHLTGAPGNTTPPIVTDADLRGTVASMVLTRGQDITLCLVGSDGQGLSEAIDPVPAGLGADAVVIDTAGAHGSGDTGFQYVSGFTGKGVTGVVVHGAQRTIHATVEGGRWTAWWPAPTGDALGDRATVTVTLTGGVTRTLGYNALPYH